MKKTSLIIISCVALFSVGCTEAVLDQVGESILVNGAVSDETLENGALEESDVTESGVEESGLPSASDELDLDEDTSVSPSSSDSGEVQTGTANGATTEGDMEEPDAGYHIESGGTASIPVTLPKEDEEYGEGEECLPEEEGTYQMIMLSSTRTNSRLVNFVRTGQFLSQYSFADINLRNDDEEEGSVGQCRVDPESPTEFSWQRITEQDIIIAVVFFDQQGDQEIDFVRVDRQGRFAIHADLLNVRVGELVYLELLSKKGFLLDQKATPVIQKQKKGHILFGTRDIESLLDHLGF